MKPTSLGSNIVDLATFMMSAGFHAFVSHSWRTQDFGASNMNDPIASIMVATAVFFFSLLQIRSPIRLGLNEQHPKIMFHCLDVYAYSTT